MSSGARVFVWAGGALFVAALAGCAWSFAVVWARTPPLVDRTAVGVDLLLFTLFAAHHSLFARDAIKQRLARLAPPALLRSVYVWIASILLIVVCLAWRRVGGVLYHVTGWRAALHAAVQLVGLAITAGAVRIIDPLELAGIHAPAGPGTAEVQIAGPYRWVRHPIYLGWILMAFGAAYMTGDRLLFAAVSSLYLVLAIPWEERALERDAGASYRAYRAKVPWRVIPYIY